MASHRDLILTFYGDDFTGSTDSLEALAMAGIPAMLFMAPPSPADLARYPKIRALGVAGTSRSQSPDWMERELAPVFERLKVLGAPICHYKTCSTFDSAPEIGSIGRAAEIGRRVFGRPVLAVVGVTRHKRYVVFSNLFAAGSISGTRDIFRIDRHPTMSRHPVTPMAEADLRRHLALQTDLRVAGFDFLRMLGEDASAALAAEAAANDIVLLDTFDEPTTLAAGRLLIEFALQGAAFVVGSSGVEYAIGDYLRQNGLLADAVPPSPCGPAERMVTVCGSCSPVTDEQIAWAEANGMDTQAIDTAALVLHGETAEAEIVTQMKATLARSPSVVFYTARGPDDPQVAVTRAALERRGLGRFDSARVLGGGLGRAVRQVLAETGIRRAVFAGGDSSSQAVSEMGVEALEVAGPLVPGAPLCRIHAAGSAIDGVVIALKGGQVGASDFFGRAFAGK